MGKKKDDGVGNKHVDKYILDPEFLEKIVRECGKKIEGEQEAIRVLLICASGRLVLNAQPTSYNLLINSESGAGKDYVTSKVLELFPKDEVLKRTRISPTAFTYWNNSEKNPSWTWDGKTLYLEDASNNVLNSEVLKTMCSGGSYATIVVNQDAKDLLVNGKPVIIVTSASASPNAEILRRFSLLNLDESIDQTEAIMRKKAKFASDGISPEYNQSVKVALRQLKPHNVKIPYAEAMLQDFPTQHLIIRTHWDRFLDLIKASAVLHQYQREKDEEEYLLANGQDYDVARAILIKTTTNVFMIPLTKLQQKLVGVFNELDREKLNKDWYSLSELEEKVSFCSDRSIRTNCEKLTEFGILEKEKQERENSKKPVMAYREKEGLIDLFLPTWEEINCRITSGVSVTTSNSFDSFLSVNNRTNESNESNESTIVPPEMKKVWEGEENDPGGEENS